MPGPEQLLAIRGHIAGHAAEFRKIVANARLVRLMEMLKGDELSRVPKGFAPDHPAAELIRKKQWLYYVLLEPAMATTPRVLPEVLDRFRVMYPFLEYLNAPLRPRKIRAEDLIG